MGVLTIIICSIIIEIIAFTIVGTPVNQKAINLDKTRTEHFLTLRSKIESFYDINKSLPNALDELTGPIVMNDPETNKKYGYKKLGAYEYQLCTVFSTQLKQEKRSPFDDYGISTSFDQNQSHDKGYDCLEFSIPDYYRSSLGSGYKLTGAFPSPTTTPTQVFENISNQSTAIRNNDKRMGDVNTILNAIIRYKNDKNGDISELGISTNVANIASPQFKNMCKLLVPTYINEFPLDPVIVGYDPIDVTKCDGESWDIFYTIVENPDKSITVAAPRAELGEKISTTQ